MQIQFLGATDTVTGSKYLLTQGNSRFLVDCGLFPGLQAIALRNWSPLPVSAASIDAVILTHALIDHSGYLPLLARQGFSGPVADLPVYLNSPMAASATSVYARHQSELRLNPAQGNAWVHAAQIVHTPEESRELNPRHGPMIIIAASGMATGGRVLHHLNAFAPYKRNTILFAGFQAGGRRGATISGEAATVRIFGEDVPISAEVPTLSDLSARSDAAEIIAWLR